MQRPLVLASVAVMASLTAACGTPASFNVNPPAALSVQEGNGLLSASVKLNFLNKAGRRLLSPVFNLTRSDIWRVRLNLTPGTATVAVDGPAGGQTDQLDETITFNNLKANTNYTLTAIAYNYGGGEPEETPNNIISLPNQTAPINVGTDNEPEVNLAITLQDVPFSGSTSQDGISVTPGGYADPEVDGEPVDEEIVVGSGQGP